MTKYILPTLLLGIATAAVAQTVPEPAETAPWYAVTAPPAPAIAPASAVAPAQTAPAPTKLQTVTLTGCVVGPNGPQNPTTFSEGTTGSKYRLGGKNVKNYAGRRVEVVGTWPTSKVKVVGGLWPTPNVAAQAGAMDTAQAAIAAQPGSGAAGVGPRDLPEFRVTQIRTLSGACQ